MAPKNAPKNAPKAVEKEYTEADNDSETSSNAPVKEKKKRVMTPEMLEILRLARLKSLETKKSLAGAPEKRIEFYKEQIVKKNEKVSLSKKGLKERAVAEVSGEVLPDLPIPKPVKVKSVVPVVPDVPVLANGTVNTNGTVSIPKCVLATLIARLDAKPINAINTGSIPEPVPIPEPIKKKKVVKYVYEESTDSEGEDKVVVVKKKEKALTTKAVPPKELEQRAKQLINPRMNSYNIFGQRRY